MSACWTAERYDIAVDINGNLLGDLFCLKMDGEGVDGFKAMGDGMFLSWPTNNPRDEPRRQNNEGSKDVMATCLSHNTYR